MPADIAATLKDLLRSELPEDVNVHASAEGVLLQPARKRWAWSSGPACEIVFSVPMVGQLRQLAGEGGGVKRMETLAYLEYVAAAVGLAYEEWQGDAATVLHLDARSGGVVLVTPWDDARHQRRA